MFFSVPITLISQSVESVLDALLEGLSLDSLLLSDLEDLNNLLLESKNL